MTYRKSRWFGFIASLFLALTMTACDEGFLNREPLDEITDESFWQTEDHLKLAANGMYAYLKGKNTVDMENLGDNTIWPSTTDYQRISTGNFDNDLGGINSEWTFAYDGIRRANHFMANYQKADLSDQVKAKYAAEVRFVRVYLYSYLTSLFGDVQFITKPLEVGDPEVFGTRQPKAEIVQWMLEELDAIAPDLPVTLPTSEAGRATRGAALALKARIALYNQRWAEAEQAAKAVMDLGVYELYSNGDPATSYWELFTYAGRYSRNASNRETILARVHLTDEDDHNLSREMQVPDQAIRFNPTKSLVDAYLMRDGLPIDKSPLYLETSYDSYFANRDPRMTQTILAPGSEWKGRMDGRPASDGYFVKPKFKADKKGAVTVTGWYFTKYIEPSTVGAVSKDENDIILLRYAEVLLTYAEALYEQGKLNQAAIDITINKLRERVGMHPMNLLELTLWGMDLGEEIRRERRVELALEGQRYFDILRWKQGELLAENVLGIKAAFAPRASDVSNQIVDENGYIVVNQGRTFVDPKNYLWPIPLRQLERNPNLGQNEGW